MSPKKEALKELNIETSRKHTLDKEKKEYNKRRKQRVCELYHSYGLSIARIAMMFDVHRSTIHRWLTQEQENQSKKKS